MKSSKRVQACLIKFPRSTIIWLNTYFPTDPQIRTFDDSELRETLAAIKSVIEDNEHDHILWQGDINTEFKRHSKYVEVVQEALEDLSLKSLWTAFAVDFTFCSPTDTFFSTIDHSLVSESLENSIKSLLKLIQINYG